MVSSFSVFTTYLLTQPTSPRTYVLTLRVHFLPRSHLWTNLCTNCTPASTYLVVTYYPTHALKVHIHLPNNPLAPYICTNHTIASTYIPSIHLLSYPYTKLTHASSQQPTSPLTYVLTIQMHLSTYIPSSHLWSYPSTKLTHVSSQQLISPFTYVLTIQNAST